MSKRAYRPQLEILEDRRVPSAQSILDSVLVKDEADVRAMLGPDLLTLGGVEDIGDPLLVVEDIGKLLLRGYAPGHEFTSFFGIGLAFGKVAAVSEDYIPQLGEPTVLFYRPTPILSTTDPFPDPPYEFIGWAYAFHHDPQDIPGLAGFPADAWQVHEAGIHRFIDGGFTPVPPPFEESHGSGHSADKPSDVQLPDIFHERLWNISFYTDPTPGGGPAQTAIHDPFGRVPQGFDSGPESFFYPEIPFTGVPELASRVEAENFDMSEGYGWFDTTPGNRNGMGDYRLTNVDLSPTADFNGGQDVTQTALNEMLQYTINVPTSGMHDFGFRVSNDQPGARFRILVDGVAPSNMPANGFLIPTGGGASYLTFEPFAMNLTAGQHRVRVIFNSTPTGGSLGPRFNHFYVRPEIPTAHLQPIPDVVGSGLEFTEFTVTYRDDDAINRATIDSSDIRVRNSSGSYNVLATLMSKTPGTNFNEIVAVYRVDAPDDSWDPSDRDEYQVLLQSGQVRDQSNPPSNPSNAVPGGLLGTFQVAVPFFEKIPVPREIDEIDLYLNGLDIADEITLVGSGDFLDILIENVASERIPLKTIRQITVFANGGNDGVRAAGVSIPFTIYGGTGDDELIGGEVPDVIRGGPGNDLLDGRGGIDTIFGDDGDDKAVLSGDRDIIDLGTGKDGVVVEGTARADLITVQRFVVADGAEVLVTVNGRALTAAYRNGETVTVFGKGGNDIITSLGETTWSMEFFGGAGNDILIGGQRDDVLDGGAGNDLMDGREGADRIFAKDRKTDLVLLDADDKVITADARDILASWKRWWRWLRFTP